MEESYVPAPSTSPRTLNVLVLLAAAAAVFSYLGAYAVTAALVKADLLDRWPPGADPRPRWMLVSFLTSMTAFVLLGALLRWSSNRQMRAIDESDDH